MDISKLKISVGLLIAILIQGGGFVWFISELNSQVNHNSNQIEILLEQANEYDEMIKIAAFPEPIQKLKDQTMVIQVQMDF